MIKYNCSVCNKECYAKYKSHVKKYCSHKCANRVSMKERAKKTTMYTFSCEVCGKEVSIKESERKVRERNGRKIKYCSYECSGKAMRKGKEKQCPICHKSFYTTRGICCSVECKNKYSKISGVHKKNGYWYENGYKVLYLEGNKSIKEHIKVMEEHIGRKLHYNEIVHHIDGNKLNNKLSNLRLMTRGEHSKLHREMELQEGKVLFS